MSRRLAALTPLRKLRYELVWWLLLLASLALIAMGLAWGEYEAALVQVKFLCPSCVGLA